MTTLEYSSLRAAPGWRVRVGRSAAWIVSAGVVWTLVGVVISGIKIESIIFTGPVLMFIGIAALACSVIGPSLTAFPASLLQVGYPMLVFIVINLFDWGPSEAHRPVFFMNCFFFFMLFVLTILAWFRRPVSRAPWECRQCGYMLLGLTQPRCPECGTGCDLQAVQRALAAMPSPPAPLPI
jgi:hypothetical protein